MYVNDLRWDNSYKYVWYSDNGPWSTRFTAWYVAGLLNRNKGEDLFNAKAAIENMSVQFLPLSDSLKVISFSSKADLDMQPIMPDDREL